MPKSSVEAKVVRLWGKDLDEAINILSGAFEHDPLMRFIFERSAADFQSSLAELFRFSCEVRFELEWPPLGCIFDSKLVGVACVTEPGNKPWPESLSRTYE